MVVAGTSRISYLPTTTRGRLTKFARFLSVAHNLDRCRRRFRCRCRCRCRYSYRCRCRCRCRCGTYDRLACKSSSCTPWLPSCSLTDRIVRDT